MARHSARGLLVKNDGILNCMKATVHLPYFVNKSFPLKIRNERMRLRCFDQVTINIVNNALVVA